MLTEREKYDYTILQLLQKKKDIRILMKKANTLNSVVMSSNEHSLSVCCSEKEVMKILRIHLRYVDKQIEKAQSIFNKNRK